MQSKTRLDFGLNPSFPIRTLVFVLLLVVAALAAPAALRAQNVTFAGAIRILATGFNTPYNVAVDSSGNVYVADTNNQAVKEILAAGGYTTLRTLGSGFSYPEGVAVDANGNVFVADSQNYEIKEMLAVNGSIPAIPTINTLGSGFANPGGVAVDQNGNVFVADSSNNLVKEIVAVSGAIPSSPTIKTLGSGFNYPSGVAVDRNGNVFVADSGNNAVKEMVAVNGSIPASPTINTLASVFGVTFVAVDGSGNVFYPDVGAVKEIEAVNGSIPASPTIKSLSTGGFSPGGLAVDGSGDVFFADFIHGTVNEIAAAGGIFGQVNVGSASANPITLVFTFDAGGTLGSTTVLTQGAAGLDFTDAGGGTCTGGTVYNTGDTCTVNVNFKPTAPGPRYGTAELLDSAGDLLGTGYVQGTGIGPLVNYMPGTQSTLGSGFSLLEGVAADAEGNVFVGDTAHNAVKEIVAAGGYTTVKTLGSGFSLPAGVAVDGSGNVFVADTDNSAVKELVAAGGYVTVNTLGSGFSNPYGVAVDGSGNVFVGDTFNNAVREIVAAGGYTTVKFLGNGFSFPEGVAVDGSGNVFVADYGNNAVKEIVAASGYTTVRTLGSGFDRAASVAVDGNGNVFVADTFNSAVKEIVAAGGYTTVNTLASGFGNPYGVAVDSSGNVYVADTNNNAVQKLDYSDPPSLSFASAAIGSQSADSPQTVTVTNIGNAPLTLPIPASGNNPNLPNGFALDSATTCPQLTASSAAGNLDAGTSCDYAVDFIPTIIGANSGSLTLTDDNLNAAAPGYATQMIMLSGTGAGQAPSITTNPSSQTITAGAMATCTAASSGDPTPTVQWQVNGGAGFSDLAGATSTTLSFTTTAGQNGYQYRAVFTNSVGTATTTPAMLTVNYAPSIATNPSAQTVTAGAMATFTATSSGVPTPTVQWQVNSGAGFTNITGATSTTLSFTTTASQNAYQYRAVFTNSVGTATTSAAMLTVDYAASITTNPSSQTVTAGAMATLTAAASGVPTPTVQWQVNSGAGFSNLAGATSTTLSFTTTASQNGYQYRAVFTNSVGTATTTAAMLTVNYAPSIATNPSSQTVTAGSMATFTAAASGVPTPTVQWQVNSGAGFSNISGATSTTLSFTATSSQNGYQYRAVFTNSVGTATTTEATLAVEDFSISASPSSQIISSGHSAIYTISLTSLRGLTGNVALTCSGAPIHSTCTTSPSSTMLNSKATTTVNLYASQSVNHGTFTLTLTGTLGNITHSTNVSLTVK